MSATQPISQVAVALRVARAKLNAPPREGSPWVLLGAASLAAFSALAFAFAVILGPPTLGSNDTGPAPPALRPLQ